MILFIHTFTSTQTHLFSEVRHMLLVSSSRTTDVVFLLLRKTKLLQKSAMKANVFFFCFVMSSLNDVLHLLGHGGILFEFYMILQYFAKTNKKEKKRNTPHLRCCFLLWHLPVDLPVLQKALFLAVALQVLCNREVEQNSSWQHESYRPPPRTSGRLLSRRPGTGDRGNIY